MKVLVTGGAGFVGSHLVDKLVKLGHKVIIFDNLDAQVHLGKMPNYINQKAEFIKGDVRNYNALKKVSLRADVIFHYAAAVGVGQSQYQIKKYVDVNTGGTANLLDILANNRNKVKKVIVAASMSSYGEGAYKCKRCGDMRITNRQITNHKWEPLCPNCKNGLRHIGIKEGDRLICNSIYAITKKVQEEMVLNFGITYGVPAVALRFFNIYGPRQSLSNPYTGVAAIFISRIKNDNPPIVYEDGAQTRDFISVHDIVDASVLAMDKEKANYEAFNLGTGIATTIKSIAEKLILLLGKRLKPEITNKFRKGDIRHCIADITKLRKRLGFEPKVNIDKGLRELIGWSMSQTALDKFDKAQNELKVRGLA